jgi:hypothetical protein
MGLRIDQAPVADIVAAALKGTVLPRRDVHRRPGPRASRHETSNPREKQASDPSPALIADGNAQRTVMYGSECAASGELAAIP